MTVSLVVHTTAQVVVVMVADPVSCALVVVMLEVLGPVKVELLVAVKLELLGVVKLEPVAAMSEPVAVMLEPVAAMLELVVTRPPAHNLEPVESGVPALLVKQSVRYHVCATEW